ncbi:MAG: 30S ribosome-binding factor RbfA [Armatimonadota bacterium]
MTRRQERVGELIRAVMSEVLLRETRDPRLELVTVTEVRVTADLRDATVYVSALGGRERAEESLRALRKAAGYLRCELAKRAGLRVVPTIAFRLDPAIERGARVFELLEAIRQQEESRDVEGGPGSEESASD